MRVASRRRGRQYPQLMLRLRALSPAGLLLVGLASSAACSAPPGQDDSNTVPEFGGALPSAAPGAGSANTPNGSALGAGPATTQNGSPSSEAGNPASNVSLDPNNGQTGSNGAGAPPVDNAGGAGGATMTVPEPGSPDNGAGGSAMPSAAGGGNVPVDMGTQTPPPNGPGTQNPPPNDPPRVDPGPVGVGCAPGVAFFCEDFESFNIGTATMNDRWRPEGTVQIDGQTAQGTRSLHVQANAGQASRIFVNGFAPPNNSFFGRMNVFVQAFPTAPNFAHWVLVEVTGNGGERVRPIGGQLIQDQNTGNVWGVGSDGGATGDWTAWRATAPAVSGRWQCLEWQMDAADNSVDVYIDGTLKPELSVSTNDHDGNGSFVFPQFNNIWLGWTVFQGGSVPAPFNVFIDDIVLSAQRVGCN